ncbi:MAG: hypothetical protein R3E73_03920 [Porticoccaceae bacterium]|nr:hypothetical protein [Pseudomonadales bacterium]MCP5172665.1 hypothetical protein [Pseudomonadales bacterium]MCP5302139.1 hypothetical protein [Pseudomonadales bacterium]
MAQSTLDKNSRFKHIAYAITAVLVLIILSGCDFKTPASEPAQWAVVDEYQATKMLTDIAKSQNPYPEGLKDDEGLNQERRDLSKQINNLKRQIRARCTEKKSESRKISNSKSVGGSDLTVPPSPTKLAFSTDRVCQKQLEDDPLIHDLTEKQVAINKLFKERSSHEQKIKKAVKALLHQLIKQRFENEYALVLSKRSSTVLYNRSQQIVDVTEKLLDHIRTTEVVITVRDSM